MTTSPSKTGRNVHLVDLENLTGGLCAGIDVHIVARAGRCSCRFREFEPALLAPLGTTVVLAA